MGASGPLQGARAYPGKVAIRRVVEAARDLDLDVAAFSVAPDGTITVMEARAMPQPEGLFDRLDAEGKI
jgi:hypothetical protein